MRRETSRANLSTAFNLLGSSHEAGPCHPELGLGHPEVREDRCLSDVGVALAEWASVGGAGERERAIRGA